MFGTRKSWQQYAGVEAISSTNDPDPNQQGVWGVLQWAAGPVGLRVGSITSMADDPFIETGPRKIYDAGSNVYRKYPYYSYDLGPGSSTIAQSFPSRPLSAGSYNKYTVWNNAGTYRLRFCSWQTSTNDYTDCSIILSSVNMGRQTFDNVVAGGESLCGNVQYGCPVGYIRHMGNRFLDVTNNVWYAYCYTFTDGSPYVYNAPAGYRPDGQWFAAGRVGACGPFPNPDFDVLYR